MYNLKPCPFCGGYAYMERNSRAFYQGESCRVAYVRCTKCEARSAKFPLTIGNAKARFEAEKAWNARADNG